LVAFALNTEPSYPYMFHLTRYSVTLMNHSKPVHAIMSQLLHTHLYFLHVHYVTCYISYKYVAHCNLARERGLRERLALDDIFSVLQQNRLRWYEHVLQKEDND